MTGCPEANWVSGWASAAHPFAKPCSACATKGSLAVESKSGWYVLPIDFARLGQLYGLRIVLELASIDRLVARRDELARVHQD